MGLLSRLFGTNEKSRVAGTTDEDVQDEDEDDGGDFEDGGTIIS